METIQNDTTYTVWSTLNVYLKDGTERYDFNASNEFISQLPVPVKTINERDKIVYIEQKNKKLKYFVRSDLTQLLDSLTAFKVKSLDEIPYISIQDEAVMNYYNEFTEYDRIEESDIKIIGSSIAFPGEYDIKTVTIVLKDAGNE